LKSNDANYNVQLDQASKVLMVAVALNNLTESNEDSQPKISFVIKTLS